MLHRSGSNMDPLLLNVYFSFGSVTSLLHDLSAAGDVQVLQDSHCSLSRLLLFSSATVSLLVNRITQKLQDGLPQNLVDGWSIGRQRTSTILVWIQIRGRSQECFYPAVFHIARYSVFWCFPGNHLWIWMKTNQAHLRSWYLWVRNVVQLDLIQGNYWALTEVCAPLSAIVVYLFLTK